MWKFILLLALLFVLPTADAQTSPRKSKEQLPILPLPLVNNEITQKISQGQWRKVFLEAIDTYPQDTDTVRNQALSGYIEDALQALPNLRPDSQSWVLFCAARELKTLAQERRIAMFRQAAEVVRAKTMPANIKADALAHASIGLFEQGKTDEALTIMREALQGATNEPKKLFKNQNGRLSYNNFGLGGLAVVFDEFNRRAMAVIMSRT
ncbi:MAG: hypothetical protein ACXV8I_12580 [Methylobacter sp.]